MVAGPRFEWVNHASFLLEYDGVSLLCDPWLTGTAFNDGWRLTSPTHFTTDDFARVTHIWFSHQHPDHFSPRDLKAIPPDIRSKITILYHATMDKKVINFCRTLGFKQSIEMEDDCWVSLAPRISVLCNPWFDRDSWLAIRTDHHTFLNLNDCVVDTIPLAQRIAARVGPVDMLFTQFSYADWSGNPEDIDRRRAVALERLERIRIQCDVLQPKYVVPFASYMWFSHDENFSQNFGMNSVAHTGAFIEATLRRKPLVMYPGDTWIYGQELDWRLAAQRYANDVEVLLARGPVDRARRTVTFPLLERATQLYLRRIKRRNPLLGFFPALHCSIDLTDLNIRCLLSLHGIRHVARTEEPADIAISSESLLYALRTPWGCNALAANARYTVPQHGRVRRFFQFFRAAELNDHGRVVTATWIVSQVAKRLSLRRRRQRSA